MCPPSVSKNILLQSITIVKNQPSKFMEIIVIVINNNHRNNKKINNLYITPQYLGGNIQIQLQVIRTNEQTMRQK